MKTLAERSTVPRVALVGSFRGAAIGAHTSFWNLGLGIWGPITGVMAAGFGYPAGFSYPAGFVVGAACAAGAVAIARLIPQPGVQAAAR